MKENQTYIEFKKAAVALNLSDTQLSKLDSAQIKQMSKTAGRKLSENFIANMKALMAEEVRAKKDSTALDTIETALKKNFPNLQAQIHREPSGRVVVICLDGDNEVKHG